MIRKLAVAALLLAALTSSPATAEADSGVFPSTLELPIGFSPEGITIGAWPLAYFGSMTKGTIYQVDLVTGKGKVLAAVPGTKALGMKVDARGRLFVAGGDNGDARVIDTRTGRILASYQLAPRDQQGYIDDVVLTQEGAWFTDARNHQFYQVPFGRSGELAKPSDVVTRRLSGAMDGVHSDDPRLGNSNGIATTPDGRALLIGHLTSGKLFRVDLRTGFSTEVDLGDGQLVYPDGIFRQGRTLYVAEVFTGAVVRLELDAAGGAGKIVERRTGASFDFPTAVAAFGNRLYVVNANFDVEKPDEARYSAVGIPRF